MIGILKIKVWEAYQQDVLIAGWIWIDYQTTI